MITSSGAKCDVCGNYILGLKGMLGLKDDERVNMFSVKGIKEQCCCHNKCKELLEKNGKDWKQLPKEGMLYKIFKETSDKLEKEKQNG